jgi:hypothetical protein
MDWQAVTALTIVVATAGLFVWAKMRRPKFSLKHDTHCGCSSVSSSAPNSSIVFRARKGERPEVVVKMK